MLNALWGFQCEYILTVDRWTQGIIECRQCNGGKNVMIEYTNPVLHPQKWDFQILLTSGDQIFWGPTRNFWQTTFTPSIKMESLEIPQCGTQPRLQYVGGKSCQQSGKNILLKLKSMQKQLSHSVAFKVVQAYYQLVVHWIIFGTYALLLAAMK